MKSKILHVVAFVALFATVSAEAKEKYTIVSVNDTIIGDLKKTDVKVQIGENPVNAFSIQRVVKADKSICSKGAVIMLPGSSSTFKIFEIDENGQYENSFAGYLASQGYDVFGYSPRVQAFGFGECSSGMVDCSIMKDWGFNTTLNDLEYLKNYVKQFHANQKPVLLGWSLGAFHVIAGINAHPNDFTGAVVWEGLLYSKNAQVIAGNKVIAMGIDSLMNSGIYFDSQMESLLYILQLAVTDPEGISPIPMFPAGTTNMQAFVMAASIPGTCPPSEVPGYLYCAGNDDFSGFQYTSFPRLVAFGQALLPYESNLELKNASDAIAGNRTYTKNLEKYKAPLYVVGAGNGFGKYMKDNINLFGSHDVTWNYISQFGHADHYLSANHRQILDTPILLWLNRIFKKYKSAEAMEAELSTASSEPKIYPNPASDIIMVSYELQKDDQISLYITDFSGKKILDLISDEKQVKGKYELPFNISRLTPGVYIYVLQTSEQIKSGKLSVIK
jgi:hypothetical protein